ncbi:UdgX family uracil-DNA binding protein [Paracoccus aurantiacus]|uniref:Type-4 uracil-DNA glycosylase n=1 Tax=Paracoccus aurantiacus TaxID=2599412 RepID=A0A5C6S1G2_9RHOB|nr:UdgX family uracil-DNA binding protein [Paracoccus aurantiacus]TXB68257.1 UdgX family uracil-DNA binding protein [Paracoccus aurantiacus]
MIRVDLPRFDRFEAWRSAARRLAGAGIAAADVTWADRNCATNDLFGSDPLPPENDRKIAVSRDFIALARSVSFHSDPERWALLHAALMRFQADRRFMSNPADPMVVRLQMMSKSVRRDIHKMHAFVRFHEMPSDGPRRAFAAWFEPEHPILQVATPFFARRFADMDWMIATPEGVARFDGELHFLDPVARPDLPADASHALWQTYFANIFNPARINTQAMRSEMPLKYWKNLPETRLIADMLADAPRRVDAMAAAGASNAPAFAAKVTARLRIPADETPPETMDAARDQAARCTRCDLCHAATRTVWGEGNPKADLMIVGEAPGDQEDLQGRPFVGPAGKLLRDNLDQLGIDQDRIWFTNAVKHFKFAPRGKRRLHQNPDAGEISHCRWWLGLERRFVRPRLTLALGASAAFALTGRRDPLSPRRGKVEVALDGGAVLLTWHPSRILRLADTEASAALEEFRSDLRLGAHQAIGGPGH